MPASIELVTSNTPMGANLVEGGATFRTWAPVALEVHVLGTFNEWQRCDATLLTKDSDGYWSGFFPGVREFDEYKFWIVGPAGGGWKRDPYARELTPDWPQSNCIVRSPSFPWQDSSFETPEFSDFVIYQLHVGTFYAPRLPAQAGTFLDVVEKLEYLDDLGVTCLQLLPIVEFQTLFSMGYNGTDYFSPEMEYGVPDDRLGPYLQTVNRLLRQKGVEEIELETLRGSVNQLKTLVNLAHLYGMAVIFDVVYNHAGGEFGDESLYFFDMEHRGDNNDSLYFTSQGHAGGLVFAFWKREVRQFLIDNAKFFLEEYHVDGFRYDQVSVLVHEAGENGWRFCQALTETTKYVKNDAIDHAEFWNVNPDIVRSRSEGGAGFDCTLHDGLRESIRRVVGQASYPGDHEVDMDGIARQLRAPGFASAWQAVQGVENHDEVYRDREARMPSLADPSDPRSWFARSRSRVALGLVLFAPGTPMLFMGQEFLEDKQWADDVANHADKLLHWEGLAGEDPSMGDFHRFTREAIATRFRHAAFRAEGCRVIHVHNRNRVIAFQRWTPERGEDVVIVASLNSSTLYGYELGFPGFGAWTESFNSDVYDHWVNPQARGNGGGVHAWGDPRHAMPTSAQITIPANSVLVFSKA